MYHILYVNIINIETLENKIMERERERECCFVALFLFNSKSSPSST
jgi:hypothetical protein